MYVPTTPTRPSPQARELGQRIAELVTGYVAEHPGISPVEVSQSFRVARSLLPGQLGGRSARTRALIAVALGLLALGGLLALMFARSGSNGLPG